MADIVKEFKALKLYGMARCRAEMAGSGTVNLQICEGLVRSLLEAENIDRGIRSIRYRLRSARFPVHRDLAGFEFEASAADRALISQLSDLGFTDTAQNIVFVGGTGTGKSHLATALGVKAISQHGKGALLLHRRAGQHPGAGEGGGQARPASLQPHARGPGHP